ncbi:hypothetical protein B0H13DRAFT_1927777 [Mycena leptocephala]|nr:hypothetical protein B0H13DRAFT_1927777 [Mycena leptocephala]
MPTKAHLVQTRGSTDRLKCVADVQCYSAKRDGNTGTIIESDEAYILVFEPIATLIEFNVIANDQCDCASTSLCANAWQGEQCVSLWDIHGFVFAREHISLCKEHDIIHILELVIRQFQRKVGLGLDLGACLSFQII